MYTNFLWLPDAVVPVLPINCKFSEVSDSLDSRVVKASASKALDSNLVPSWLKPMTLNLVFTASLLDAQY